MCFRSLFLPDVIADRDYSVEITDGVNTDTVAIPKGAWWANSICFGVWLNLQLSTVDPMTLHLERRADGTVALFNTSANVGTLSTTWTGTGRLLTDIGGTVFGRPEWDVPGWSTTFPPRSYMQGVVNLDGQISYAHDGAAFSLSGEYQRKIQLAVYLDRRDNAREYTVWRSLWRGWWSQGRSVSFWLEEPEFADGTGETTLQYALNWGEAIGKLEQLVVEPRSDIWRPERLVQAKENRDFDEGEVDFWIKKNRNPMTDTYMDFLWIPS